jgi:hypothetical protein
MSLILWKAPVVDDPKQAEALLQPWYDRGDDRGFEPSADLALFAEDLSARFPDDPSPDPPDESGRVAELSFERSERLIFLSLRPGAGEDVLDSIVDLAAEHRLVLYHPEGPDIVLPDDELPPALEPPPGFADYVRFALFGLASAGTVALGWRLDVPVLGAVMIAFGGFLTAVFLLIVLIMLIRHFSRPQRR